jgi:hypothetical protein
MKAKVKEKSKSKKAPGPGPAVDTSMTCACCGATDLKLMLCTRCRDVSYCSRDCQAQDWKAHKAVCVKRTASKDVEVEAYPDLYSLVYVPADANIESYYASSLVLPPTAVSQCSINSCLLG